MAETIFGRLVGNIAELFQCVLILSILGKESPLGIENLLSIFEIGSEVQR